MAVKNSADPEKDIRKQNGIICSPHYKAKNNEPKKKKKKSNCNFRIALPKDMMESRL